MATNTICLFAEKKYELSEIGELLKKKMAEKDVECAACNLEEVAGVKILHTVWERWYLRTGSFASLSVLLLEYDGVQKAEVISSGGKETFFSWGAESNFAGLGAACLTELGFAQSRARSDAP